MARLSTVLDAISDASLEIGIVQSPVKNVVGTADGDIAQLAALLQNVADELLLDPPYRDQLGDGNWLIDAGFKSGSRDQLRTPTSFCLTLALQ